MKREFALTLDNIEYPVIAESDTIKCQPMIPIPVSKIRITRYLSEHGRADPAWSALIFSKPMQKFSRYRVRRSMIMPAGLSKFW